MESGKPPVPETALAEGVSDRISPQQRRVVEFALSGAGNGVVQATAGAGKTTTLLAVAESIGRAKRVCFLAFGRDAANELRRRLPPHVHASTVHSLARAALLLRLKRAGVPRMRVDRFKYGRLARSLLSAAADPAGTEGEEAEEVLESLLRLAHFARLELVDPHDRGELGRLVREYNVVMPADGVGRTLVMELLPALLSAGAKQSLAHGIVDFTDMLHLPVALGLPLGRFDFVCVDEAQDYSLLALEFTTRLVDQTSGGRLLFVGDPNQSIFGFAGASSTALGRITRRTRAAQLPLSISYRCPRSHISLAQIIAPQISPAPDAIEGRVYWIEERFLPDWARGGDLLLCRANAPLITACLNLVSAGRPAFLLGRDLAGELRRLAEARGWGSRSGAAHGPRHLAGKRLARPLPGASDAAQPVRAKEHKAEPPNAGNDDLERCLATVIEGGPGGRLESLGVLERIDALFQPAKNAVELSTIHRAKGKEADRVLLLHPERMPAPYARGESAIRGEICVQFVALTRARQDLVFVAANGAGIGDPLPLEEVEQAERDLRGMQGQGAGLWPAVISRARSLARSRTGLIGRGRPDSALD